MAKKAPTKQKMSPLEKELIKLRDEILSGIGVNIKTERSSPDREVGDFYDDVDVEKDRQMVYMLGERERAKLNAIEAALEKLKDGTYGFCEECGAEINKKRLKILPFARYCITCQSEIEKRSKYTAEETEENLLYKDISLTDMESGDE
ncbi:MAG: TraR/DksA family transcriptional regulator [Desulfobacterota bacterium]|nr:TraR/DksA family transcriptional regulator [Thermodesulfobacteriota bacterium]